ncbi:MAG: hypothetical protein HZB55_24535 [Deltaproteobacteria bacterium]|nr:hypothetical protein [Deltaproteobacteria bacterium]
MRPVLARTIQPVLSCCLLGLPFSGDAALLDHTLTGTVVVEGGPSFAIFQPGDGLILVREGEEVVRGIRLLEVQHDRVVLEEDSQRRELTLGGIPGPVAGSVTAPVPEASASDPVTRLGDTEWQVDRSGLAKRRVPLFQVMAQLQVSPHQSRGTLDGLELVTVDPGGLVERLGFRDGDVIRRINDVETRYMEQAYAAYRAAIQGDTVRVDLLRGGTALAFTYSLR